jgi:hypothetical protein
MKKAKRSFQTTTITLPGPKICPVCGLALKGHPKCQGCGILIGKDHIAKECHLYLGHNLCKSCRERWNRIELLLEQEINWERFLGPRQKKAGKVSHENSEDN